MFGGGFMIEVMDGDAYIASRNNENNNNNNDDGNVIEQIDDVAAEEKSDEKPAKKKRKKQKKNVSKNVTSEDQPKNVDVPSEDEDEKQKQLETTLNNWSAGGVGSMLHPSIIKSLSARKYYYPTPIQSRTLASSLFGKCDVVGAAPTGSGKTIAYLLPIVNFILQKKDDADIDHNDDNFGNLIALILTPTRELALQVTDEARILLSSSDNKNNICTIIGGMAQAKQKRQLQSNPCIIIATPGRL